MNDIGLKSYQHIEEPEYITSDRLPPEEWKMERDRVLRLIFDYVLSIQDELGIQLHFEWIPHCESVSVFTFNDDARWHKDGENKIHYIVDTLSWPVTEYDDPIDWCELVRKELDRWADSFEGAK